MKRLNWKKGVLSLMALALLAGCGSGASSESGDKSITVTSDGDLASLDIMATSDSPSMAVLANVEEGLYRPSQGNEVELGMAAEEPEISEDGTVYTFKLRSDANWSNGDPVTAEDFVYSYKKAVTPGTLSQNVNKFFPIKNARAISKGEVDPDEIGLKAIDDKTLEITLEAPTSYFKGLLGTPAFLPQPAKLASELGEEYGTTAEKTAYNGPYKVEGWSGTEGSFDLVKNDQYWDKDNVQIPKIKWVVSKEGATNYNLFNDGKVQYTKLTAPYVEQAKNDPNLHIFPSGLMGYLSLNYKRPATANVHIRKALFQSVDKDALVNVVLQDGSRPIDGWVPEDYVENPETGQDFREENGPLNPYDLEKAQAEWEQGKKELGVDQIELELLTTDTDTAKNTSEFLQGQWEQNLPGLKINIKNVPLKSRQKLTGSGEFDIMYGTYSPSYVDPTAYLEYFESDSNLNSSGYASEVYDKDLHDARSIYANDPVKRWDTLLHAERQLIEEDAAVGPLYQGSFPCLIDPKLQGVINQTNGASNYFRAATYNN